VIGPNLSEWALGKRSLVIFLMIVAVVAGTLAFLRLGRGEDPVFTFRTMIVAAAWPGATVEETLLQVTERLERDYGAKMDAMGIDGAGAIKFFRAEVARVAAGK